MNAQVTLEEAITARLPYWRFHPDAFAREAIGYGTVPTDIVSDQQMIALQEWGRVLAAREILTLRGAGMKDEDLHAVLQEFLPMVEEYSTKSGLSIMSGKGCGKDTTLVLVILHFMSCFPGLDAASTKIICTATSQTQLDDVLWSELSMWFNRRDAETGRPIFLFHPQFELTASKFNYRGFKETWFCVKRTASKRVNAQQSGTMAGLHAPHMLIIFDEWSDVHDQNTNALLTTLTSPMNFAFGVFNPTKRTGAAYQSHHDKDERKRWVRLQWDSRDSPLVTKEQISRYAKYGERSNLFRVNVAGLPPLADDSTLIPWDWAQNAVEMEIGPEDVEEFPVIIGIDPAGGGSDRYIACARQGGFVHGFKNLEGRKLAEVVPEAMSFARMYEADYIVVDNTGGYGAALVEMLSKYHPKVYGPAMSETAFRDDEFANVRAEVYWRMRTAFEKGAIRIPNNEDLIGELTCIQAAHKDKGRLILESKKEIRKRLSGLSPDHADALALTYYVDDLAELDMPDMHDEDEDEDDLPMSWRVA